MYQALYRKYRPSTFEDVISQPHITTTLKNQIVSGKTAHAYLFTGSRGTGKTTCARIFAKALNCENPRNGSPCGECSVCRDADNFALSDIIEIDAASNGSVNDARELREAAEYTPERCKYKVYIIDEVHMLSKEAFNALLKVIEEPPAHVKFIMATTELHKVLATILSRCQRFDFRRIRTEDISERLHTVAEQEGIVIDNDAADLIAKVADGGMRDALSILDRCIAFSENVTADVVSEAAGIAGRDYLFSVCEAVADKNAAAALDVVSELYSRSKDMRQLCEELAAQMRNVMIAISTPDRMNSIVCLPSELDTIKRIASKMTLDDVLGHLECLSSCSERMVRSMSKRIDMEMCLIRMCSSIKPKAAEISADSDIIRELRAKISSLEEQLRSGASVSAAPQKPVQRTPKEQVTDMSAVNKGGTQVSYIERWADVIEELKNTCPAVAPALNGTYGYEAGSKLLINSKDKLVSILARSADNKEKMLAAVRQVTGKQLSAIIVGYRAEFDRALGESPSAEMSASVNTNPDDAKKALLEKAENGGVPVETM